MSSIETISERPPLRLQATRTFLGWGLARLALWYRAYRTRVHLLDLSDQALEDLGLTRDAARAEALRPFWDAGFKPERRR